MTKRKIKTLSVLATAFLGTCALALGNINGEKAYAKELSEVSGQAFTQADYTFEGYSLRFDKTLAYQAEHSGNTSLRFKFSISPALYGYLQDTDDVKTGTLIYPSYYLEEGAAQLTVDSKGGADGEVVPFDVDTTLSWRRVEGEDVYQSVTYLKEIPAEYYGFGVAVRGYLQVGEEYFYTTATAEKSLAEVADLEYKNIASTFTEETKTKLKETLLKYTLTIDGVESEKYYGQKITAPLERTGYLFVGYRIGGSTEIWDVENTTVYGDATLTSEYVRLNNYHEMKNDEATFAIPKLPSGVTKAYIGEKEYACSSTYQSLTITGLTDLEAGKTYVVRAVSNSGKSYFAAFTAITEIRAVAKGDFLSYDFSDGTGETHKVVSIVDEKGKEIEHTGAWLDGIPENSSSTPREQLITVTDDHEDKYVFLLKIYTDVIHTNEDADWFFLGEVAGDTVYWEYAEVEKVLEGCYALTDDVTLSVPLAHTRTQGGLRGVFDGMGHTITWTSDAMSGDVNCSPALFGYNFTGTIKNTGFDFTVNGTYGRAMNLLSDYATAKVVTFENIYVNVKVGKDITVSRDLSVSLWGSRVVSTVACFKDVVVVNSIAQHGLNGSRQILVGYDRIWMSGNKVSEEGAAYLGENNMVSTSVVNMQGVHVIVGDSVGLQAAGLAYSGSAGWVYAENTKPDKCKEHEGWYKGSTMHNYGTAKDKVTKVGSWVLDYGTGIENVSATYEG